MDKQNYETHDQYIMDVLEDDKNKIMKEILKDNPNLEYNLNRLIEVVAEIVERNNNIAN
jgi:hypothetical protein